ncbi:hypothetical protein GGX14DRAFT_466287 [Mycena pura]|uniref:Uncharacterized protein n=1 Tax=Mycena pura TaxID=153505 RepID=A0AAD6V262_9AGAR|nr:hypothetical protein GGX14DRAFT_466287 [Mycena pura]
MSVSAADLKAEGNILFTQKNFREAETKYTAAIEASDETADSKGLAILYANRAACRLSLKRHMDACADAAKAAKLDPTYAKAHARMAVAQDCLGNYSLSVQNWKCALGALPTSNLTLAEQQQKAQYKEGLEVATARLAKLQNIVIGDANTSGDGGPFIMKNKGCFPWDIAAEVVARLRVQSPVDPSSSAWVVHFAYEEFMKGVRRLGQIKIDQATGTMAGMHGGIVDLSNGVLRDVRVMHIPESEFFTKYNNQVMLEMKGYNGWRDAGPDMVIREALARQRTKGWAAVRPALSITIRSWIMQAVMNSGMRQLHNVAVEFYKNSLHVIRTLRESWILESKDDRGAIFQKTFIFGIQNRYIEALMMSYVDSDASESAGRLEELLKESELLIREIDEELRQPRSQDPVDPGFISSFYVYPRGHAYAMKGFYYNKISVRSGNDCKTFLRKAALEYITAAKCFPEDDETHPWYLYIALGNMLNARSFPLRETLDVMKRIRISALKAKEIWRHSSLSAGGVWDKFKETAKQEEELRCMVLQGRFTMNSCVGGEPV